ncbi:acyl-homoserine-lactone synthase [Vibrio sp. TRT 21S02]|uniref:acyl-homoserine-lactone synthase n=1 Tax=unclassified Vibrio TaxID=2614977 RepID=UPI003CEF32D3
MSISVHANNFINISQSDFHALLSLRYKVFAQRLNWDVETESELERDEYDVDKASYIYIKGDGGQVIGCWRVLPTTTRYMLKNTFSVLLGEQQAPKGKRIFELSRFAVDKDHSKQLGGVSNVTMTMFQALYRYAKQNDIESYVTVTSVAIEKLITRMGIPNQRIGDQQVHVLGDTRSVALHIPMNRTYRDSVGLQS